MDLISSLRRWALRRPRVLLVDAPGHRDLRWQVEAELDRRGWPIALSPADTDLVVVLGTPGPELAAAVDVLWTQIPQPRHRVSVDHGALPALVLDAAAHALVTAADLAEHTDQHPAPPEPTGHDQQAERAQPAEHAGGDQHAGHGAGGHEGHHMDHGGEVAGLAMAQTAPDRDGLELDALTVSLGPVLPGWPTGLVVRAVLQGDVLQGDVLTGVQPVWADAPENGGETPATGQDARAAALDRLAAFLLVAGWSTAARDARRARDAIAAGDLRGAPEAARVARRVHRSRTLAWSVGGMGVLDPAPEPGTAGDVLYRVRQWCAVAAGEEDTRAAVPRRSVDVLPVLLAGTELATARLVVASLELDPVPVGHGPGAAHG